jgi:hypothetical protein
MLKKDMEMRRIHKVLIKEEQKILRADRLEGLGERNFL